MDMLPTCRPRKMASRKPAVAAPADSQDPEMPDHDLEPPRFARRALERLLNDWPAVSAMLSTGRVPGTYLPKDHIEKMDFQELNFAVVNWPNSELYGAFVCIICYIG